MSTLLVYRNRTHSSQIMDAILSNDDPRLLLRMHADQHDLQPTASYAFDRLVRSTQALAQVRWLRFAASTCFALILGACASMPPGATTARVASSAFGHPEETNLGRALATEAREHAGLSAFRLLQVGVDGYLTRIEMIEHAERSVDVQYFIFRSDETGRRIADALVRAADRGVHVRILVDDGETVSGDENVQLLDAHPNVEVRVYNPFAYRGHNPLLRSIEWLANSSRLDYRMHNKLMVADNAIALVGGRNVADEYFQVNPKRQFADDDLFVAGPVVPQLSDRFDAYWNSDVAIPVAALAGGKPKPSELDRFRRSLETLRERPLPDGNDYRAQIASVQPLADLLTNRSARVWAKWRVVCDSPDKKAVEKGWRVGGLMERPVADAVSEVREELLMVTPYLIPGDEGMQLFGTLRRRGTTVRLLTNSLVSSTVPAAQAGYMHYREALLATGAELHEIRAELGDARGSGQSEAISRYGNYSLHGKMFVFDRKRIFIGSMNFDQRSMHLNTEIGLIIDSDVLARQVADRFEAMTAPDNAYRLAIDAEKSKLTWTTVENGAAARYDQEPARNAWQRLGVEVLTLIPLDKEL